MKRILLVLVLLVLLAPIVSGVPHSYVITESAQGYIRSASADHIWSWHRGGAGDYKDAVAPKAAIYSSVTSNQYQYIQRGFLIFDTASIPDGEYVKYASLYVAGLTASTSNLGALGIVFVNFTPDNYASVVAGDFDNFGTTIYGTVSDGVIYPAYLFTNAEDFVTKTGKIGIGIRITNDASNTAPTWASNTNTKYEYGSNAATLTVYTDTVSPDPSANFTANTTAGPLPLTVQFNDTSTGTPLYWSWSFGDGSYYSGSSAFAKNPTHTYTVVGLYDVSLYAQNVDGSDTETKIGYINVTTLSGTYALKINPLTKNLQSMAGVNISIWSDSGYTSLVNSQVTTAYVPYYSSTHTANQEYYILMNKSGYYDRHYTRFLNQNIEIDLVMYLLTEVNPEIENYTSIHVYPVNAYTGLTVSNALVSYYTDSGHTALYGSGYVVGASANMYLLRNETYYGRITASGYYPYDFSVATGSQASIERTYHLNPYATPVPTATGTAGPTPTYMTIATLSQAERDYKVSTGLDIWYLNADFLSMLFFIAVVMGTLGLIMGSGGKRR